MKADKRQHWIRQKMINRLEKCVLMQFELNASMMCANYGHLEKEVQELDEGEIGRASCRERV